MKQSLITKTARSQERERKSKVIERAEREERVFLMSEEKGSLLVLVIRT